MHIPAVAGALLHRTLAGILIAMGGLTGNFAWAQAGIPAARILLNEAPAANIQTTPPSVQAQLPFSAPPPAGQRVAWDAMVRSLGGEADEKKLLRVNAFFNRHFQFRSDREVWAQEDYWATPEEFMAKGSGDCEDFAIAKYATLVQLGIPAEHLRLMYVRLKTGALANTAHMVLGYTTPESEVPLILDNLITSIRPLSQRKDLALVFSFNTEGLWTAGATTSVAASAEHLSQWHRALQRMPQQGWDEFAMLAAPPASRVSLQVALGNEFAQQVRIIGER